jgi:hypothetical protein
MRNKITIGLSLLALVIGAVSLQQGWDRVSQVLIFTAAGLILAKWIPRWAMPGDQPLSKTIIVFQWLALILAVSGVALKFVGHSS